MADHPLILKDFEVRAILDGRKTQKRRILRVQPTEPSTFAGFYSVPFTGAFQCRLQGETTLLTQRVQYAVGDRLWAREPWRTLHANDLLAPRHLADDRSKITYEADPERRNPLWSFGKLRPSTHMPRWASRITLLVTEVRIQRLQDISEADALAEGIICQNVITDVKCYGGMPSEETADRFWNGTEPDDDDGWESAGDAYAEMWTSINGEGSWEANPWVVACTFSAVKANIDHVDDEVEA